MDCAFSKSRSRSDGLESWCKDCRRGNVSQSQKGQPIVLSDPAAVWATKPMKDTYWQQAGLWMLGEVDEIQHPCR